MATWTGMLERINWERDGETHYAVTTRILHRYPDEVPFKGTCGVRAVREGSGWRIDFCDGIAGAWLPWEPIDTHTYPSIAEARAAIGIWRRGSRPAKG